MVLCHGKGFFLIFILYYIVNIFRENQKAKYPLHVRFKPKFIAFNENLIYKDIQISSDNFAFLHFFFLYPLVKKIFLFIYIDIYIDI